MAPQLEQLSALALVAQELRSDAERMAQLVAALPRGLQPPAGQQQQQQDQRACSSEDQPSVVLVQEGGDG